MPNALEEYLLKEAAPFRPTFTPFQPRPMGVAAPPPPVMSYTAVAGGPTQADEVLMWQEWKKSGYRPDKLEPLHASMERIIHSAVHRYRGVDIPPQLIRADAERIFIEALKDYDPKKGAKLSTHVTNRLQQRLDRFVKNHQNLARVVESRAQNWSTYQASRSGLQDQLGRDPTKQELAVEMTRRLKGTSKKKNKVTAAEAGRYMAEDRRDLVQTGLDQNAFLNAPTQDRMVLRMVEEELTPEEKAVYERMFGLNGKRAMQPGEIARDLRIHPSKVSRLSASIGKKIEAYY
jgi:DNA-directed RNA polymerase specialized sigma subunit